MVKIRKPIVVLILTILTISVLINIYFYRQLADQNTVIKVVDGDSIDLADGRRIRLLGIDAPEKDRCGYDEAREKLSGAVLGKRIILEDMIIDDYGRILANVFVGHVLVNKVLVEEGLARFTYVKSPHYEDIKMAMQRAKESKQGIFSSRCQTTAKSADCLIKGNIRDGKEKIYHLPSCFNYDQVIIDEAFGDRWFCEEQEAVAEGFHKAAGCKN